MNGLCFSNELIARDEALHTEIAFGKKQILYNMGYNTVINANVTDSTTPYTNGHVL